MDGGESQDPVGMLGQAVGISPALLAECYTARCQPEIREEPGVFPPALRCGRDNIGVGTAIAEINPPCPPAFGNAEDLDP